jgi:hypothetical protein
MLRRAMLADPDVDRNHDRCAVGSTSRANPGLMAETPLASGMRGLVFEVANPRHNKGGRYWWLDRRGGLARVQGAGYARTGRIEMKRELGLLRRFHAA